MWRLIIPYHTIHIRHGFCIGHVIIPRRRWLYSFAWHSIVGTVRAHCQLTVHIVSDSISVSAWIFYPTVGSESAAARGDFWIPHWVVHWDVNFLSINIFAYAAQRKLSNKSHKAETADQTQRHDQLTVDGARKRPQPIVRAGAGARS